MKNRTCAICGKAYRYCPSCYEDRHLENWHIMFHDENCKNIFHILTDNYFSHISDTAAAEKLGKCDLSGLESFCPAIKKNIEKLEQAVKQAENHTGVSLEKGQKQKTSQKPKADKKPEQEEKNDKTFK